MKATILLIGYPETDASGNPLGKPRVVAGPPADEIERREIGGIFAAAKQQHRFPKGIRYLAFVNCEAAAVAAHISDDVTALITDSSKLRAEQDAEAAKVAGIEQAKRNRIGAAHEVLRKAALVWNAKREALTAAKNTLADAEANYRATKTELFKAKLDDSKKRLAEVEAAEVEARKAYEAAKQAKQDAIDGKVEPSPTEETGVSADDFKDKSDEQLLAAAKELKLEIKPGVKREELIIAIGSATQKVVETEKKGFFAKLFGK